MDAVRILDSPAALSWDYDEGADVLYISEGDPRPAVSIDLGEGILARYDERAGKVVGLTVMGLRARLLEGLAKPRAP
jgi:uncharacterized protein YuzE